MQRHWSEQELETYWSFSSDELTLIPHRDASSRLGVAASLKFFQLEGFFPHQSKTFPLLPWTTWRNCSMSIPRRSRITIGRAAREHGTGGA